MQNLTFDESSLEKRLAGLNSAACKAFAATVAERLFPSYVGVWQKSRPGSPIMIVEALDRLWNGISSGNRIDHQQDVQDCEALLDEIDQHVECPLKPQAEDAIAALTYALRCAQNGEAQEAVWAARRAYEAVDSYAISQYGIPLNSGQGEQEILGHAIVQQELHRQKRDLCEIAKNHRDMPALVALLRDRCRQESQTVFATSPD